MDVTLHEIVGTSSFSIQVLDVIEWAEHHGRTEELIDHALAFMPDSPALQPLRRATKEWNRVTKVSSQELPKDTVLTIEAPGGAVRLGSRFYIARPGIDDRLFREIAKPIGTTITIRGPRQVGKTSLLVRAEAEALKLARKTVYIDLPSIDNSRKKDLDTFLYYLATVVVDRLDLDISKVDQVWQHAGTWWGPNDKISTVLAKYVLPFIKTPFLLIMDEVEQLLDYSFHDDFFGLVRGWHNLRARNPLWEKLHIIMAISTEPHLLIKREYQSPFNVSLMLEMMDFTREQVSSLEALYETGLTSEAIGDLMELLGGHPYLTQQALYTMVTSDLTWSTFALLAPLDVGPFGSHLSRNLALLQKNELLANALRQVMLYHRCSDLQSFQHLLRAGLVKGINEECMCRCELYAKYLQKRL